MNKPISPKMPTIEEIIAQNPQMDLRGFHEWLQKKAELEANGIDTKPLQVDSKPKRQQSIPFSALGL